jgi:hypothetical protein
MRLRTGYELNSRRRGGASVYLIVSLPVLLLAIVVALNAAYLVETRTTLQNSADAAALAAALTLVDDRALEGGPGVMADLMGDATAEAQAYARMNPVLDEPVIIKPNPDNDPNGDIVFGALDRPHDKNFVVFDPTGLVAEGLRFVNTVRVTARRTQEHGDPAVIIGGPFLSNRPYNVASVATATIDRDVIGFRPHGNVPVPMVPIALLSDRSQHDRQAWEFQVERHGGEDHWRFDRVKHVAVPDARGDGLFEMQVRLSGKSERGGRGRQRDRQGPNGCVLHLGVADAEGLAEQITSGLRPPQLQQWGGQLVLFVDNEPLVVPGGPADGGDAGLLMQALEQLRRDGTPRVWPLFSGFDPESGMPVLTGFVAARVVQVGSSQAGNDLSFTVQPCALSTVTAVTDPAWRGVGGATPNRYVSKVRLIE